MGISGISPTPSGRQHLCKSSRIRKEGEKGSGVGCNKCKKEKCRIRIMLVQKTKINREIIQMLCFLPFFR